jgi:hypothetical protein
MNNTLVMPKIVPADKPLVSLEDFTKNAILLLVGRGLTEKGIDKTMLISILLKQAVGLYTDYQQEVEGMEFTDDQVLDLLTDKQREEVAHSKNKRDKVMGQFRRDFKHFKEQTKRIIEYLEANRAQMESASPAAQLRLHNLLRADQGLRPVKRLPKPSTLNQAA